MEGGALFKVRSEAKEQELAAFAAINKCKNEVGGYTYNDANTLVTEIQLFDNTLTEYKATISIKRKDVLKDSKDAADRLSNSSGTTVQPEITTKTDSEDGGQSRGRSKGRRRIDKKKTRTLLPSPSTSRSPTPPPSKGRSSSRRRSKSSDGKKD
jgi:hypothetical protein